jgi:hydrogenase maturation protease
MTGPRADVAVAIIAGVGQRFAGDDGVGPAVIDRLRASPLPPHVALRELREPSALVALLDEPGRTLVIVDAVLADPPGEVRALDPAAVGCGATSCLFRHGLSVGHVLAFAAVARPPDGAAPEVRIVGVNIARPIRGAKGLSPAVAASVPEAARLALALLERTAP